MAESDDDYESMSRHRGQTRNKFRNERNDDGHMSMMPLNGSAGGGSVGNSSEHSSPYYGNGQHHHSSSSYNGGGSSSSSSNHGKNHLKRKERDYHPHSAAAAAAPYDGARNHRGPLYAEHPMPESDAMLNYHRGGHALDPYHMQTRQHPNRYNYSSSISRAP